MNKIRLTNVIFYVMFFAICNIFTMIAKIQFDIVPLKCSFVGATYAKGNIIVYGTQTCLLISTDLGKNWKLIQLYPSNDLIKDIQNFNDTLYGVIYEGKLIVSTDYGLNWKTYNLAKEGEVFYKIFVNENSIYIRTNFGINKYSKTGEYLKSFITDDLKIDKEDTSGIYILPPPKHKGFLQNPNIFFIEGKFFFRTPSLNDGFIILNDDFTKVDTIILRGKVKTEYSNPYFSFRYVSKVNKDKYLFDIFGLYFCDSNFQNWRYFFNDPKFFNPEEPNYYKMKRPKTTVEYINDIFFLSNDTFFIGFTETSMSKVMISGGSLISDFHYLPGGIKDFQLYFYSPDSSNFLPYGNAFDNFYFTPKDYEYPKTRIEDLYFKKFFVFSDSIIIKVGFYNSILLTTNRGQSWNLVSSLNGEPQLILNDTTFFFVNHRIFKNDIDRSFNGGSTFLPTEIALDSALRSEIVYDSTSWNPIDTIYWFAKISYLSGATKTSLFYMDTTGKGFWFGDQLSQNYPGFAYTSNFAKNFKFDRHSISFLSPSNVLHLDSLYYFTASFFGNFNSNKLFYSLFVLDTSFKIFRRLPINYYFACNHIHSFDEGKFILFGQSQPDTSVLETKRFEIRLIDINTDIDSTLYQIDVPLYYVSKFYSHNKDSIFFTTEFPDRLYLYNVQKNELKILWESEVDSLHPLLMVISDRFYIVGRGLFLE
ncbi:MAG: WD40/YVTN/BNR-like repeat-containing protein, partial [Caldisericum exile]|uniref:WD40/YVTN/BNR-like repeat-containing protein n=1 Tax=Caldisericum exile TaxID=693075 RepID=UPI003C7523B1